MKVFLDASVILAGLHSEKGGSHKILLLGRHKVITPITTQTVLEEVGKNLHKISSLTKDLKEIVNKFNFVVREAVTVSEASSYISVVDPKDAHVIAGAILTSCDFLITLDKKYLLNIGTKEKIKNITISSPKEFLTALNSSL